MIPYRVRWGTPSPQSLELYKHTTIFNYIEHSQPSLLPQFQCSPLKMNFFKPNRDTFTKSYKPVRLLGEGGYEAVWLVKRIPDGHLFAAKLIPDSRSKRKSLCEDRSALIPNETLLSETLDNPNLLDLTSTTSRITG